ncbi:copia protein [Tanacetum coccineum]
MTTLVEHIIVAGAENRPSMLEKSMYNSWVNRIRLFIKGKKNRRMMLDSIDNGPLVYLTVEENGHTQPKKYSELTEAQQLQDVCDVQATNIILHGLPPDVYALVNQQEAAKDIWDRVKLLMKGTELSYQERECRFKFVTDVKLAKSLYTTNYDQLYAYLSQHERHANEACIMRERYPDPLALVANSQTLYNPSQSPQHSGSSMYPPPQQFTPVYAAPIHHQHHYTSINPQQQSVSPKLFISPSVTQQSQAKFPQLDSSLAVPIFQQGEDPIDCINKAMAFLSVVASSFAGIGNRGIATTSRGNYAAGQAKIVKCYNCLGEGHMVKQCTQPKRPRSSAWFKEKFMLDEVHKAGQILDEEQLAFIADPGIAEVQVAQQTIPQNSSFQTEDLDAYDSNCDDISLAKAVLMENLSSCDPDVLFEVPYYDSYPNDMINQDVQEMAYYEQTHIADYPDKEINSDSNIIPYSQYMKESQDVGIQDTNSSAPNELLVLSLVK